jgi:GrpB-like predicted nucleotidyltransferase (UPF0157 family)
MTARALGLVSGRPVLVDHDPRWAGIFQQLRVELLSRLTGRILNVYHVGSTSVPGLRAKPVLDVLVGVPDLDASLSCVPVLAELGFVYGPDDDLPDRHYFRGSAGGLRTHHLSLAEPDSAYYRDTLAFRDALRASPELAREYEALKERLIAEHVPGRPFHIGKTEFVARVLAEND